MDEPRFPRADADTPAFWEMRWRARVTPWDSGRVPAQLAGHLANRPPRGPVLVPGCGSGHDVRHLAEAGFAVTGLDFSAAALDRARPVAGPYADRLVEGDFFTHAGGPYALVYERAFLCALPRRRWRDWAEGCARLVMPGGELAGFFYFGEGERGPPFALSGQPELAALLADRFDRIEDLPVPDSIDVFAGRERWQAWRRRG